MQGYIEVHAIQRSLRVNNKHQKASLSQEEIFRLFGGCNEVDLSPHLYKKREERCYSCLSCLFPFEAVDLKIISKNGRFSVQNHTSHLCIIYFYGKTFILYSHFLPLYKNYLQATKHSHCEFRQRPQKQLLLGINKNPAPHWLCFKFSENKRQRSVLKQSLVKTRWTDNKKKMKR